MSRAGFLFWVLALAFPLLATGTAHRKVRGPLHAQGVVAAPPASGRLSEQDKLDILRTVDGEFARAVRPLPSLKSGFLLKPGRKFDQQALDAALIRSLPAANPGDKVQITAIQFRPKQILININGGSHPNTSWRQRIHVQVNMPFPSTQVMQNQPPGLVQLGSTLILDFGRPVPSLTPEQVKQYLSPFLNFANQASAVRNWVDTIPAPFRQAIGRHEAVVGMNRKMVLAALGLADHKVREFKPDGTETEDWIYGNPPGTTIFVTFLGDTVVKVKQFP
ncbi:MAG TPA: hypothetical protein VNJ12_03900 [Candidatus Dormibacteraeota bacterium]|nr:hypothetical protein [Candidatus Dormibacteraeota bacterium]